LVFLSMVASVACTTVDPGPNYVVPDEHFDADYFFCHVEPEVLFAKKCGPGDASQGDNGCHFTAAGGFALLDHPPIDCGGGDHPVDRTKLGSGSPAQGNYQAASLEMSRDYTSAPIYVRPTKLNGASHPRQIFNTDDAVVSVIQTWASKP
jgi:hypothetical protein